MKITFPPLILLFLTGCFYGKVKVNTHDKAYIPYNNKTIDLVFVNSHNQYDTITLHKSINSESNLDHFIDRRLGHTSDRRKPYYETYETNIEGLFKKTLAKSKAQQPYIKCTPLTFSFNKHQNDSLITLFYFIDGRWSSTLIFSNPVTDTLHIGGIVYKDVITLRSDTIPHFNLDKLYWSVQYGLIRINERDGEQWNIVLPPLNPLSIKTIFSHTKSKRHRDTIPLQHSDRKCQAS